VAKVENVANVDKVEKVEKKKRGVNWGSVLLQLEQVCPKRFAVPSRIRL
jgi:hypothetical protein